MADEENTSTVAESTTTPASAEPVESTQPKLDLQTETPAADEPRTADDVWNTIDAETEEEEPEGDKKEDVAEKPPSDEVEKEATVPDEEEKPKEEEGEKSLEEQALEEAFSDEETEKTEAEKEEDLDKLDPQEQIERQRNATAKAWADRNFKRAEIVKDYAFRDTPIADVATKLEELNPDRYIELSQLAAHKLVDSNPQATFERAYAVKMLQKNPLWDLENAKYPNLDDVIANGIPAPNATAFSDRATTPPTADLQDVTSELDKTLGWDWRNPELDENFVDERELTMAKTIRALEAKASEPNGLAAQNKELEEKLKDLTQGRESIEQERIHADLMKEANEFRGEIEKEIMPYVLKSTGLEISPNDTPEIKAFKENRQKLFTGTDYDRANNNPSQFESFAYNESTVRNELETITKRIVTAQLNKLQARDEGDKAAVDRYQREINDEKLPFKQLFGQATKEFKAIHIAPDMALIGKLSATFAEPIREASERVEVVSNGSSTGSVRPQKKDYSTADDVWSGMVEDAAQEEKLRATT